MNKFDRTIRTSLIAQAPKMPEDTSKHFDSTLSFLTSACKSDLSQSASLKTANSQTVSLQTASSQTKNSQTTSSQAADSQTTNTSKRRRLRPLKICTSICCTAAAACAAIVMLVNINQNISYAMQDIPFIGNLIRVVTVYKKDFNDDYHYANVSLPQVDVKSGLEEPINYINADVKQLTDSVLEAFYKDVDELPNSHFGLTIDYDVITNTDTWFTLRLLLHYNAGSSNTVYRFYHIDKIKGKIVKLSELFDNNFDYQQILSSNIKLQIKEKMAADDSLIYWIEDNPNAITIFKEIDADQNFYFDKDNNLVIVFDKYDIAPGYMGCPEFTIPKPLYEDYLSSK